MHRSRNVNFLLRIICQDGLKLTVFRVFCKEQLVFMQQLFDAPWANRRPEHCRNMCRAGSGLWLNNAAFHRWCSLQLSLLQKCRKYKSVSATGRCWFPTSVHNVHHEHHMEGMPTLSSVNDNFISHQEKAFGMQTMHASRRQHLHLSS